MHIRIVDVFSLLWFVSNARTSGIFIILIILKDEFGVQVKISYKSDEITIEG